MLNTNALQAKFIPCPTRVYCKVSDFNYSIKKFTSDCHADNDWKGEGRSEKQNPAEFALSKPEAFQNENDPDHIGCYYENKAALDNPLTALLKSNEVNKHCTLVNEKAKARVGFNCPDDK